MQHKYDQFAKKKPNIFTTNCVYFLSGPMYVIAYPCPNLI